MHLAALLLLCIQLPNYTDNQRKVSLDGMVKLDPFGVSILDRADVQTFIALEAWQKEQLKLAKEYYDKHHADMIKQASAASQDRYQLTVLQQRMNHSRDSFQKDAALILTPEQIAGLFKVKMQAVQYPLIFKSELAKVLSAKPDQIQKHNELQKNYDQSLEQAVISLGKAATREQKLAAITKAHQANFPMYQNGVAGILTPWQKEQFDQLCCKQVKIESATFHAESLLPLIENKLTPRSIPRIVEPFPLAEIAMNFKVRQYLGNIQNVEQLDKLASAWIKEETDFYDSLQQTKQDDREDKLKAWYGKRLRNHAAFVFDLRKAIGNEYVEKLLNFQLQLRGMTVLGDKNMRTQLGMTDDQYNELTRINSRKIYEEASRPKTKNKQLYMRMPDKIEALWFSHFSQEQQILWENLIGKKIPSQLLNEVGDEIVRVQSARVPANDYLKVDIR
ncbi:MAG: hypothetical protein JNJ77_20770 [Planctomycetia bacterium]|nr:hypothetical protein [Planctomycetia bacterium]